MHGYVADVAVAHTVAADEHTLVDCLGDVNNQPAMSAAGLDGWAVHVLDQ